MVEEEGGQGGGADVHGHAVVGKGGGQVELGHFPGEADLALAGMEELDDAIALHFGAAGQAHPLGELLGGEAGNFRRGRGADRPGHPHPALAAAALAPAGGLQGVAGQQGVAEKGALRDGEALVADGDLGQGALPPYSPSWNSTAPK